MTAAATLMFVYGAAEAHASWGSFGSHGGSWGGSRGFGSHGGSWGSSRGRVFGGSHGGPVRNLIARVRSNHSRGYSSFGSHGGSFGGSRGYASRGSMGSRGHWGSTGSRGYASRGSVYHYYSSSRGGGSTGYYGSSVGSRPVYSQPVYNTAPSEYYTPATDGLPADGVPTDGFVVPPTDPTPELPTDGGSTPPPGPERADRTPDDAGNDGNDTALLNLRVPAQAVVYVNGRRTTTPGSFRQYASRNLKPGRTYTYEVKAELERDGKMLSRTKVIQLTAGADKTFAMDFQQANELITSVTLFVPEDASVTLGGVKTDASGTVRYFSTTGLKEGQSWNSYHVVATVERDGKQIRRERTIDVNAGDSVNLRFEFDKEEQVATR